MLPAPRRRAPSPDYWRHWWIVPLMIFCGITFPGLGAQQAHAATVNNTYNVCTALRHGATLGAVESQLAGMGMSSADAGAYTGNTVRKDCPDQTANVTAQAKSALVQRAGA